MIEFIKPDGLDEDDLCEICIGRSGALDAAPHDMAKIHNLLILALAQCQAEGCPTGDPEDAPFHWHLACLVTESVQAGARLPDIAASHAALKADLVALPR